MRLSGPEKTDVVRGPVISNAEMGAEGIQRGAPKFLGNEKWATASPKLKKRATKT